MITFNSFFRPISFVWFEYTSLCLYESVKLEILKLRQKALL